jgi:RNA polymerase sigma factor for flagellar operon FliA
MDADATEEFAAIVRFKLVDDDYAVIRAFRNRSPFPVYIAAVIKRLLLDHWNREWGKWRPSAEAERLGPLAVALERILYRDRRSLDDAAMLLANTFPGVSRAELETLAAHLPPRLQRRKVNIEEASHIQAGSAAGGPLQREMAVRISAIVVSFIARLPEHDQLLLRLRFHAEMTVAQIARALREDQQALYRQLQKHFKALRVQLTAEGVAAGDVEALIGNDGVVLDFDWKKRDRQLSEPDDRDVAAGQEESS